MASSCGGSRAPGWASFGRRTMAACPRASPSLPASVRARALEPEPLLTITKANTRSTVHRGTYLDFIGVKRFAPDGTVIGEHRILGLLTSAAYSMSPRQISADRPQVRAHRGARRLPGHRPCRQGVHPHSRDLPAGRVPPDAARTSCTRSRSGSCTSRTGHGCACSCAADPFGRFVTCLVFVPRDRYNTAMRERMEQLLREALGRAPRASSRPSCRNRCSPGSCSPFTRRTARRPRSTKPISRRRLLELSRSWTDRLRERLIDAARRGAGQPAVRRVWRRLPLSYRERIDARAAVPDVAEHRPPVARRGGRSRDDAIPPPGGSGGGSASS